ncbi:hypothetical protein [Methylocystis sp.]|uniref:hypothetical protein n=1 Tax=Methylocystis sp. TaxID=1911079 RepID=UPI003DA4992D
MAGEPSLADFVAFLESTASGASEYERLAAADRAELERASRMLGAAMREIERVIAGLAPADADHMRHQLWRALGAAYLVGAHGHVSDSSRPFWRSRDSSERAKKNRTQSPFTTFIKRQLRHNPRATAKDVERSLAAHPDFRFDEEGRTFVELSSSQVLKVSSLPAAISKVRSGMKNIF